MVRLKPGQFPDADAVLPKGGVVVSASPAAQVEVVRQHELKAEEQRAPDAAQQIADGESGNARGRGYL